ncbi:MAG: HEAT repeat domain-containing protein [Caldilineaceae bacterium]
MNPTQQLLNDEQMQRFIRDGYITVQADFPDGFHQALYERIDEVFAREKNPGNNILPRLPQIQQVFDHPAVRGALTSILGPDYLMNPHRHCHLNPPGSPGQRWHKDNYVFDEIIRHPRPRWVLAFYYPQDVTEEMGPTGVIPGRHYHHYISDAVAEQTTETALPLCGAAGTVAIVHYDSWHRATANRSDKKRYMLKFLFERMAEPQAAAWQHHMSDWPTVTDAPLEAAHADVWQWLAGRKASTFTNGAHGQDPQQEAAPALPERRTQWLAALTDEDETVRLNAAYALGTLDESVVPALIDALVEEATHLADRIDERLPGNPRGSNPATCAAAHALTTLGQPAVAPLVDLLHHAHWCVRTLAADTLGNIGLPVAVAVPALAALLADDHPRVRRHAAETLGRMSTVAVAAVPALTTCVRDEDVHVRHNAVLALAKIGQPAAAAIPALTATLADEDRYVRHFAAVALRRIGTPAAQAALLDALFTARWCPITTPETMY